MSATIQTTSIKYILKIENNIIINTKLFWKYIQSLKSNKFNTQMSMFLYNTTTHN